MKVITTSKEGYYGRLYTIVPVNYYHKSWLYLYYMDLEIVSREKIVKNYIKMFVTFWLQKCKRIKKEKNSKTILLLERTLNVNMRYLYSTGQNGCYTCIFFLHFWTLAIQPNKYFHENVQRFFGQIAAKCKKSSFVGGGEQLSIYVYESMSSFCSCTGDQEWFIVYLHMIRSS